MAENTAIQTKQPAGAEKQLFLAPVRGFCNGVRRALDMVEQLLPGRPGRTICVYHEIVHNNFVVEGLKARGVVFVNTLAEVPDGAILVWSAHGVTPALEDAAAARKLEIVDATCPLVRKLHELMARHCLAGDAVIFIGHARHPETVGVMGCGHAYCVSTVEECRALPEFAPGRRVVVLSQTTWCADEVETLLAELRRRNPGLELASGICYATGERQQAVRSLVTRRQIEQLLVIGSPGSSNSNRLCEVARHLGVPAFLIDDPAELANMDFAACRRLGLTAGASAPEALIEQAIRILRQRHCFEPIEERF